MKHFIVILLCLSASSLFSQFNYLNDANTNISIGDYVNAIINLNNHLDMNPDCVSGYIARANAYSMLGQFTKSDQDFNTALRMNQLSSLYVSSKARSKYFQYKKYDYNPQGEKKLAKSPFVSKYYNNKNLQSESILNSIIDKIENYKLEDAAKELESASSSLSDYLYLDLKGMIELKYDNIAEAINFFTQSITDNPDYSMAYHNRSICHYINRDASLAQNDIEAALKLESDVPEYHFIQAKIAENRNVNLALNAYEKALTLDGDYVEALVNYGVLLKKHGELQESLDVFMVGINNNDDSEGKLFFEGGLSYIHGDYTKAINQFKQFLNSNPDDPDAMFNLGLSLILNYDINNGCELIEESIELVSNEQKTAVKDAFCNSKLGSWRN